MALFIIVLLIIIVIGVVRYSRSSHNNLDAKRPDKSDSLFYDVPSRAESSSPNESGLKKEDFRIAGVQHYGNNISKLMKMNPNWEKSAEELIAGNQIKVYEHTYIQSPVKLVPEPSNPHDKNAIMVQIAGQKVGYFYRTDTDLVRSILNRNVKYISAHIKGGHYKVISTAGEETIVDEQLSITVRIAYT